MQIKVSLPSEVVGAMDEERGDVSRSLWIRRRLEGGHVPREYLEAGAPVTAAVVGKSPLVAQRSPKPQAKSKVSREVPDEIPLPKIARRHWA